MPGGLAVRSSDDRPERSDGHETPSLRREMDRQLMDRLRHVETRLEAHENVVGGEMTEIRLQLQRIVDWQQSADPALKSIQSVMSAGIALRWIVLFVVSVLAAVSTLATAVEAIRRWMH